MSGAVIANWPIALVVIAVIVGVPLWLTVRRKHLGPDYREARAHYKGKASGPGTGPTSDYVPGDRVSAWNGLTVPQEPGAPAESGEPIPGRQHEPPRP
jgi:hypothetical protein